MTVKTRLMVQFSYSFCGGLVLHQLAGPGSAHLCTSSAHKVRTETRCGIGFGCKEHGLLFLLSKDFFTVSVPHM